MAFTVLGLALRIAYTLEAFALQVRLLGQHVGSRLSRRSVDPYPGASHLNSSFWLAAAAYLLPTFPLGYFWHLRIFRSQYDHLAVYREEVIVPLGLSTMIIQALLYA